MQSLWLNQKVYKLVRSNMKKEMLIIFASGCAQQVYDTQGEEYISIEIIELNERECKSNAFEEIELDNVGRVYGGAGSGLAVNDLNNDGLIDIFFVNIEYNSSIFWNKGNLKFEKEIFEVTGGKNVNLVDYNGDSRIDIFITFMRKSPLLFENYVSNNKTLFRKVNINFNANAFSSDWADLDLDGDLDLVVGSLYSNQTFINSSPNQLRNNGFGIILYENQNDSFKEVKLHNLSKALVLTIFDIDDNGLQEIFVGNDFDIPDYTYFCDSKGCRERKIFNLTSWFTMAYTFGDVDNDGDTDVFSVGMDFYELYYKKKWREWLNLRNETIFGDMSMNKDGIQINQNVLQINNNGIFNESAKIRGVSSTGWSWSSKFSDFDNDGDLDLFVVNGMIDRWLKRNLKIEGIEEENFMFVNDGNGYFINDKSLGLNSTKGGRSMSFADLDNDGDMDIIIHNEISNASVYINNECKNEFVEFELLQKESKNRYSIGGKVILNTSLGILSRTVQVSSGYLSGDSYRLHFGLGKNAIIYDSKVIWPDGTNTKFPEIAKNKLMRITKKV